MQRIESLQMSFVVTTVKPASIPVYCNTHALQRLKRDYPQFYKNLRLALQLMLWWLWKTSSKTSLCHKLQCWHKLQLDISKHFKTLILISLCPCSLFLFILFCFSSWKRGGESEKKKRRGKGGLGAFVTFHFYINAFFKLST